MLRQLPVVLLTLTLGLPGCRGVTSTSASSGGPLRPEEAASGRVAPATLVSEGERVYREYCVGCHGRKGDGQGMAARFLDPKPRDFTQGLFKFASVPSGELPRDEDLNRTLVRGLPGSSMPSWALLSEGDRRAVIAYIKTLSPVWKERRPGTPIAVSPDPYGGSPEGVRQAVDRGKVVYHVVATCWQCHPTYASQEEVNRMAAAEQTEATLRQDADRPTEVTDAWNQALLPPDFTTRRMKNGSAVEDIYRTIATGIGGTAMPTWKDGLEEKDLWALAYYVKSLADRRWERPSPVPARAPDALVAPTGQGS